MPGEILRGKGPSEKIEDGNPDRERRQRPLEGNDLVGPHGVVGIADLKEEAAKRIGVAREAQGTEL